jgi:hypothetical protein
VLCDAGCQVTFNQTHVQVLYNNQSVLEGTRVPPGLWTINIGEPPQANATFSAPLKATALQHIHASLFSPATQTWVKAVANQHFATWPQFTTKEIKTLLPKSTATAMGHLDQQRKNIRSTKRIPKLKAKRAVEDTEGIEDTNPQQAQPSNTGFASLVEVTEPTHKSYSDLTGRFPIHSTHGNLYVLVLYLYDANAILVEPLRNRSDSEQLRAYETILSRVPTNHVPNVHWMDNEASKAIPYAIPTGPSPHSPQERSRTCNSHLQESLHRGPMFYTPRLPLTIMGQSPAPSRDNPQSPSRLTSQPTDIGLPSTLRTV